MPHSTTIAAVDYWPERRALTVKFKSGGSYEYANVPPEKCAALIAAPSLGTYLHTHIKSSYAARKLG